MKNFEKLFYMLGEVDEDLVPEVGAVSINNRNVWMKRAFVIGGMCAAAVLIGFIGYRMVKNHLNNNEIISVDNKDNDKIKVTPGAEDNPQITTTSEPEPTQGTTSEEVQIAYVADYTYDYVMENHRIYPEIQHENVGELQRFSGTFIAGDMGDASIWLKDIEEFQTGNPWTEDTKISALPVYENKSGYSYFGVDTKRVTTKEMERIADNVAAILGVEILKQESKEDYLNVTCDGKSMNQSNVYISVDAIGRISIEFEDGIELPREYKYTDNSALSDIEKAVRFMSDKYKNLLQYNNPETKFKVSYGAGEDDISFKMVSTLSYDKSDDIVENIVNYNFKNTQFNANDGKLYDITINNLLHTSEYMGDYPIITLEQAKEKLIKDNPNLKLEYVEKVELEYYTFVYSQFYQPYYVFYIDPDSEYVESFEVPDGLKCYDYYYVPAVQEKYLIEDNIDTEIVGQ